MRLSQTHITRCSTNSLQNKPEKQTHTVNFTKMKNIRFMLLFLATILVVATANTPAQIILQSNNSTCSISSINGTISTSCPFYLEGSEASNVLNELTEKIESVNTNMALLQNLSSTCTIMSNNQIISNIINGNHMKQEIINSTLEIGKKLEEIKTISTNASTLQGEILDVLIQIEQNGATNIALIRQRYMYDCAINIGFTCMFKIMKTAVKKHIETVIENQYFRLPRKEHDKWLMLEVSCPVSSNIIIRSEELHMFNKFTYYEEVITMAEVNSNGMNYTLMFVPTIKGYAVNSVSMDIDAVTDSVTGLHPNLAFSTGLTRYDGNAQVYLLSDNVRIRVEDMTSTCPGLISNLYELSYG